MKTRGALVAWVVVLTALIAAPRLVGIDRFATIDEPYWLTAGSDFYYALGQRAFANTFYDYHPAVTTMWVVTAALLVYFPQYRGLGQGYFDVYKDSLERFLLAHGHTPLGLLTAARVVQTALIVLLMLAVLSFMRRLLGDKVALTGILLMSFDPFFLGHSRLLNHEGMLSLFVVLSLLALLTHLFVERKLVYLLLSGVTAGFAQLTKSSGIVLLPVAASLFLLDFSSHRQTNCGRRPGAALAEVGIWLGALGAAYFVFWPGMWVAPGEMLHQVYGNALSYAFEGARLSVSGGAQAAVPPEVGLGGVLTYVQSMQWRTTPVGWIGGALSVAALLRGARESRIVLLSVLLTGFLFIALFGVVSGRNSAHYVLTSYLALDILAAAGLVEAGTWLEALIRGAARQFVPPLILAAAVIGQAASALAFFPYYYTYYNPVMEASAPGRQNPNFGYGEGLDLAASYLGVKPGAVDSKVTAFYGRGAFSYFYPGTTEPLKPIYAEAQNVPQLEQVLRASEYLVIYYELEKDRDSPANVMHALADVVPEKSIWMDNIEYIRIYRVQALPPSFFDALHK